MSLQTTPTHPDADSYVTLAEATAYLVNRADVSDWTALTDDQKEAILKQATKQIDSLRFFHEPYLRRANWYRREQKLKFPWVRALAVAGKADSGNTLTLVDDALANNQNYPDDIWNDGAVIITEGTNRGQTRKISDFASSTGTITVDTAFTSAIDNTSNYLVIEKIPDGVRYAVIEQALYIVKGGGDRARLRAEGVKSYSIGDVSETFENGGGAMGAMPMSAEAKAHLRGYFSRIGRMI
jgi:hypothetical protein